jgi:hypothetical protein
VMPVWRALRPAPSRRACSCGLHVFEPHRISVVVSVIVFRAFRAFCPSLIDELVSRRCPRCCFPVRAEATLR